MNAKEAPLNYIDIMYMRYVVTVTKLTHPTRYCEGDVTPTVRAPAFLPVMVIFTAVAPDGTVMFGIGVMTGLSSW